MTHVTLCRRPPLKTLSAAVVLCLLALPCPPTCAADTAPWGRATLLERSYGRQKVVYDVDVKTVGELEHVFDRASYLSTLNDADPLDTHIILVLHGDEIRFFAVDAYAQYRELMQRAHSLSVGGVVELRVCAVAARRRGLRSADLHGFLVPVPMADAEIIRLQQDGYAYMR